MCNILQHVIIYIIFEENIIMIPTKSGQIVQFVSHLEGEEVEQQYVVLELHQDVDTPRAKIQALNTGLPFAPISVVKITDLRVVEVSTDDLIGQVVYVQKDNNSLVLGKVVNVVQDKVSLDASLVDNGVDTNVVVFVVDKDGQEHRGTIFIK
jgi:hypothetical protein